MTSKFFKNTGNKQANTAGIVKNNIGQTILFKRLVGNNGILLTEKLDKIVIETSENIPKKNVDLTSSIILNSSEAPGKSISDVFNNTILRFTDEKVTDCTSTVGDFVLVDLNSATSSLIVTLPSGSNLIKNQRIGIKITTTAGGKQVTVDPQNGTIDGLTSIAMTSDYESVILQYNSNSWFRIG